METFFTFFRSLTWYDLVVLVTVVVLAYRGVRMGVVQMMPLTFAIAGGWFVSSYFQGMIGRVAGEVSWLATRPLGAYFGSMLVIFMALYIFFHFLARLSGRYDEAPVAHGVNRAAGGIVGLVQAVMVLTLLQLVLGSMVTVESEMLYTCASCRVLNRSADEARRCVRSVEVQRALMPAGVMGWAGAKVRGGVDRVLNNKVMTSDPVDVMQQRAFKAFKSGMRNGRHDEGKDEAYRE